MSFSLLFVSGCHLCGYFRSSPFFQLVWNSFELWEGSWDRQDRDVDWDKFNAIYNPTASRQETLQTSPNLLWPKHNQTLEITTTAVPTPKASPEDGGQMISRHGVPRHPLFNPSNHQHQWPPMDTWIYLMISNDLSQHWPAIGMDSVLHQFLLRSVGHGFSRHSPQLPGNCRKPSVLCWWNI